MYYIYCRWEGRTRKIHRYIPHVTSKLIMLRRDLIAHFTYSFSHMLTFYMWTLISLAENSQGKEILHRC